MKPISKVFLNLKHDAEVCIPLRIKITWQWMLIWLEN